jgi:hypothetical protein
MHDLEPYWNWRSLYTAEDDNRSPFYEREYSEFEFSNSIYDHFIHPQWDSIGSSTIFIKILYADYDSGYAIIEMIGEWNDCLYNDIMNLKRDIIDILIQEGINKFILIGENILNFHPSDDCYYEEWFDDIEDGWIAMLNFREHVMADFKQYNIDQYLVFGGELDDLAWRTLQPDQVFSKVENIVNRRLAY